MIFQILYLLIFTLLFTECKSETSNNKSNQEKASSENDLIIAQLLFPHKCLWDSPIKPIDFTAEQEKELISANDSPPAKALSYALNDYLAGKTQSEYLDTTSIGKVNNNPGIDLNSFRDEFYKGKFLILSCQETPSGDLEMFIIPQSNPDRIFVALMHNKVTFEKKQYVFISFYNNRYNEIEINQFRNKFRKYVKDPKYGF